MPMLSSGEFLYGSADNPADPERWRHPPTFRTDDLSAARLEMFRRANRWGGVWCVYPHPYHPGEYAVALRGLLPGEALAQTGRPFPLLDI
jgi:hypothetical protein